MHDCEEPRLPLRDGGGTVNIFGVESRFRLRDIVGDAPEQLLRRLQRLALFVLRQITPRENEARVVGERDFFRATGLFRWHIYSIIGPSDSTTERPVAHSIIAPRLTPPVPAADTEGDPQ